jgi:uncharacterized protein
MFKEEHNAYQFQWKDLGNIQDGRPNLGPSTLVSVYRLMQYTLRNVLITRFGVQTANELFVEAGKLAGAEFSKNMLDLNADFEAFVAQLQERLRTLNIGILRVEKADISKMDFVLTVSEDLDCSGLPLVGETVCDYDEGFIAGILNTYTGKDFEVKEIDCWATGDRTCRFAAKLKQ